MKEKIKRICLTIINGSEGLWKKQQHLYYAFVVKGKRRKRQLERIKIKRKKEK